MKKTYLNLTLLLLLTFLIIGCSSNDSTPTASTERPDTSQNDPQVIPDDIQGQLNQERIEEHALVKFTEQLSQNGTKDIGNYDIFAVTFLWGSR